MNATAEKADTKFWKELLEHIIDKGRLTPKFQVERAIGPILGFFLEKYPSLLGGDFTMLAAEFPLKKPGSGELTNIDWLLFDRSGSSPQLVLLELKTGEPSGFKVEQLKTYLEILKAPKPWPRLWGDFKQIRDARGSYKYKYEFMGRHLDAVLPSCQGIEEADAKVVYLGPETMRGVFNRGLENCSRDVVDFISFGHMRENLHNDVDNSHAVYLKMLCDALSRLDSKTDKRT